ncbi:MAG: hypothetical protein O2857_21620, partial [Planctomycetota bacterium]|nr:hypothetical protein [Planctomycetota bacterium]
PTAMPSPPPAAPPAPTPAVAPGSGSVGEFMVRLDPLRFGRKVKNQAADVIASVRGITADEALDELTKAGRRRYILAKDLPLDVANDYAAQFHCVQVGRSIEIKAG